MNLRLLLLISIGSFSGLYSPYRLRPGAVFLVPGEDMDMELRHHIAKCGGVDFLWFIENLQRLLRHGDLADEVDLVKHGKLAYFPNIVPARNQI